MAATDVAPNRLEAAKAAALDALRDLPTGGKVSVIAADRSARIVVNETTDLGRVRQALDGIETDERVTATSATRSSSPASSPRARGTPRSSSRPTARSRRRPTATVPMRRSGSCRSGRDRKNQAIVALAVRTAPSAVTRSVFVSVANLDLERPQRRLEVLGRRRR